MKNLPELAWALAAPEAMAVVYELAESIAMERRAHFWCGPGPHDVAYAVPLPSGSHATVALSGGTDVRFLEEVVSYFAAECPMGGDAPILWGLCMMEAMSAAAWSALSDAD